MTPERIALLTYCVEDGWPVTEIIATHRISHDTIRKFYPDYRGMPGEDRDAIAALARKLNPMLRKMGILKRNEKL